MKKITTFLFALVGTVSLLTLSSCKKIWDEIKHHPDGAADNCKVDKVSFKWYDLEDNGRTVYDTAAISYNSSGDPITILYASGGKTASEYNNKAFKYDNQHRLVAYLEAAIPSFVYGTFWHRYTYIGTNTIVDTLFIYANGDFFSRDRPIYVPGETEFHTEVYKYTLDSYGRIIKAESPGNVITSYTYNSSGNLVLPGVTYTDKTNIKQTHKTWMLITKDYSLNAPTGQATQYNTNKLPVKANDIDFFPIGYWDAASLGSRDVRISYICK
ncbi:MAG: hypothetical protein QM802_19315 [Agriterribacter sp.]